MNINNYRKRKDEDAVELKALGGGQLVIFSSNYDPATGKQLQMTKADITVEAVEKERENCQAQIGQLQELLADFDQLIADMKDADTNFETGAEILGKKTKK